MKNKLFKPILLSIMALSLIGCEADDTANLDNDVNQNQTVEAQEEDTASDNKPAEDNIDKANLKDTEEDRTEDIKENPEEDKKENSEVAKDTESKANEVDDKNLHEKDGKYVTSMIAELKGEADDYITATAYDYKFEDDRFVVSGSFDYHEDPADYENVEEIENQEDHKFIINDETSFEAGGGMAEPTIFTREDFLNYLEECKNTGLALIIFIEDGVATSVIISS